MKTQAAGPRQGVIIVMGTARKEKAGGAR